MLDSKKYYICHVYECLEEQPCILVHLSSIKYEYWGQRYYYGWYHTNANHKIAVLLDKHPKIYEILKYYKDGYNLIPRKERYRNIYMSLELLVDDIELPFRAIRHSISHSRNKLTNPKVRKYLMNNFGDVKINLNKYSHNNQFQKILRQIGEKVELILVKKILDMIPENVNYDSGYYVI